MRTFFLDAHLDECHELPVVLQVGITLPFYVSLHYFAGYLRTTAQFDIFLQLFRQVKVTTHQTYDLIFQPVHFLFQEGVLVL